MRLFRLILLTFSLGLGIGSSIVGCVATPLPTPPSATLELEQVTSDEVEVRGPMDSFNKGERVRITREDERVVGVITPSGALPPLRLPGTRQDTFYVELLGDPDRFLFAFTGDDLTETGIQGAIPGEDSDEDDSPDLIDCAPADNSLGGRDCEGACDVTPTTEACNGIDDNCDGEVDEGCACETSGDCEEGICLAGTCTPISCELDAQCGEGEVCFVGACEPGPRCTEQSDCGMDSYCTEGGLCADSGGPRTPPCETNSECPNFHICIDGVCAAVSGLCDDDADCRGDLICEPRTQTCQRGLDCGATMDCGRAETCIGGQCFAGMVCDSDASCPGEQRCATEGVCLGTCGDDGDCPVGSSCVAGICDAG